MRRIQNIFISHLANLTVLSRLATDSSFETSKKVFCPMFLAHPVERKKKKKTNTLKKLTRFNYGI